MNKMMVSCSSSLDHFSSPAFHNPISAPFHYIKFRTSHRENLRYLKSVGIIRPDIDPRNLPNSGDIAGMFAAVESLKSSGFSDSEIPRLASHAPDLFRPSGGPTVDALLAFLAQEVTTASPEDSRKMILRCPRLIFSDIEYCLRPSLELLRRVGVENLGLPTSLNAHLLNTRVAKLERKLRFLRDEAGLSEGEAKRACARVPAIFGYSVEGVLRPKYEYLVWEMERDLEELIKFPQYFGFSLRNKIEPRHEHLKKRNVKIPLNRMLLWGDQKFYAKWK